MLRNRPPAAPLGLIGPSARRTTRRAQRKGKKKGGRKANGQFKRKGR